MYSLENYSENDTNEVDKLVYLCEQDVVKNPIYKRIKKCRSANIVPETSAKWTTTKPNDIKKIISL